MDINDFIMDKGLAIIPVLWIIGSMLKQTPYIKDWMIPYILLAVGVFMSGFTIGWTGEGIIQGILVTGAAVMGHQMIKQTTGKK